MENERLTRAAAAVGAETLAKLKDLNILVIGCKGEATFNLSNRYPYYNLCGISTDSGIVCTMRSNPSWRRQIHTCKSPQRVLRRKMDIW